MTVKYRVIVFVLGFLSISWSANAQCFPGHVVTAAYATGGSSPYIKQILWLTWGAADSDIGNPAYQYGKANQQLNVGDKSRASIDLGGGNYLCVVAEIIAISGGKVESYIPGNYQGDSMDKLYNIGGIEANNKLVAGINNLNDRTQAKITIKAEATLNGAPIHLAGLVIADAESLAPNEWITATGYGTWNVIDIRKNLSAESYKIGKRQAGSNQERIEFNGGNDTNTGAIAVLNFNSAAYDSKANDYAVEFTAELKGGGLTALALGLLTPNADLGDAPATYGDPIHLIQGVQVIDDGIPVSSSDNTNINSASFTPGALEPFDGRYLGTTAPDSDNGANYSDDAKGDDIVGIAGATEEDAWPVEYRRFSFKVNYLPGNTIVAAIDYHNGEAGDHISGWIDFNKNGTFDASERQTATISSAGTGQVTLTWTVPADRYPYSTYVRLRYFDSKEDETVPSSSVMYGEVEDHRMYIMTPGLVNPALLNSANAN